MAGGVVLRNVQGTAAGGQQRQQRLEQGGPIRPGGRIKVRRRPGVAPPQAYPGKLPGQVSGSSSGGQSQSDTTMSPPRRVDGSGAAKSSDPEPRR